MNICIVGTGYVGLVTGACLAEFGMNLICVDNDHQKIALLQKGEVPIYEPGLEDLVKKNMKEGRLRFSASLQEGVLSSLVIFIAVGNTSPAGRIGRPLGRGIGGQGNSPIHGRVQSGGGQVNGPRRNEPPIENLD